MKLKENYNRALHRSVPGLDIIIVLTTCLDSGMKNKILKNVDNTKLAVITSTLKDIIRI